MKNTIYLYAKILSAILFAILFSRCVSNNETPPPENPFVADEIVPISEIHEMYDGEIIQITEPIAISGIIVMDDSQGNIYKQAVVQDQSSGLFLLLDTSKGLLQGDSVVINCKGLYLDDYSGLLQLGSIPYTDYNPITKKEEIRLAHFNANKYSKIVAINLETHPKTLTIEELNASNYQGQLVKLEHIEFIKSLEEKKYADAENLQAKNRKAIDCSGNIITIRNSGYAYFADSVLPSGNGSMIGVVSVHKGANQMLIRHLQDVNMDFTRCEDGGGVEGDILLFENFNSLGWYGDFNIPDWLAVAQTGTKNWHGDGYRGTTAEVSAYESGEDDNTVWLVTPGVDLTGYKTYTMDFLTGYNHYTSEILDVMISTDYDGQGNPWNANWTMINARIATDGDPLFYEPGGYIGSGAVDLSSYSGTVHIAFRYNGSDNQNKTTKYRVDNFRIYAK